MGNSYPVSFQLESTHAYEQEPRTKRKGDRTAAKRLGGAGKNVDRRIN